MRTVFFGTDLFALEILSFLLEKKVDIIAVVTQPDQPKGREQKIGPPPVKEFLENRGWEGPIFQPEKASNLQFIEILQKLEPDLFIVVSYGQLLKKNLLDLPRLISINVHPSLLPKYRGPSPIQSAVLAGEKEVGVTIMEMVLAMDAGDILRVEKIELPREMTFGEVEKKLCEIGKKLLLETVIELETKGCVVRYPQDEREATYTKKILSKDSLIDWNRPPEEVCNFVRGMNPRPGARFFVNIREKKVVVKVFRVEVAEEKGGAPGETLFFTTAKGWVVGCSHGSVSIKELQMEGKKRMPIEDFLKGHSFLAVSN